MTLVTACLAALALYCVVTALYYFLVTLRSRIVLLETNDQLNADLIARLRKRVEHLEGDAGLSDWTQRRPGNGG